jgi:hypothetical protein
MGGAALLGSSANWWRPPINLAFVLKLAVAGHGLQRDEFHQPGWVYIRDLFNSVPKDLIASR